MPAKEGTEVVAASKVRQITSLLRGGIPMGEAVVPHTAPRDADKLALFGD
jgi:hypothetical protein